jgi:hypothetical protein
MSNDTPVTLEQCIDWMRCNEPLQAMNPLGHAAWTAILSHLRASAAKGDVGVSEAVALLQHFTVRPSFHHDCDDYTRGYGDALAGVATQATPVLKALLARASTESAAPGEVKCDCDAGCNKCDPAGATFRDPEQRRRIEEKLLGPDCAPSPEQQGAESHYWNSLRISWHIPASADSEWVKFPADLLSQSAHAAIVERLSEQGAEQIDYETAPCVRLCSRENLYAFLAKYWPTELEQLRTPPAPALGLSEDERRALNIAIGTVESTGCAMDRDGCKQESVPYHEAGAYLRSLLERGSKL